MSSITEGFGRFGVHAADSGRGTPPLTWVDQPDAVDTILRREERSTSKKSWVIPSDCKRIAAVYVLDRAREKEPTVT
jgi:hypothetical protein